MLSILPKLYSKKGRVQLLEEARELIVRIQRKQPFSPEERRQAIACFNEVANRAVLVETKQEFALAKKLMEDDAWFASWFNLPVEGGEK